MLGDLFFESRADRPPLRVGLLVDSLILPSSSAEVIDHIRASNFARLELLVTTIGGSRPDQESSSLYRAYERWDARHRGEQTDPIAPVDCSERLRGVMTIDHADVARIRESRLDVLVRMASPSAGADLTSAARCGVWSLAYGGVVHGQGPTCFWEVATHDPLTRAELLADWPGRAPLTLCRAVVGTEPGISQVRNRPRPYWAANGFIIQKLHELHQHGEDHLIRRSVPDAVAHPRPRRSPTNWDMARWLVPTMAGKVVKRLRRRRRVPHWRIALRHSTTALLDGQPPGGLNGFRWIESPAGRSYADPFLVEHERRTWLFFEDFDYAGNLGRISAAEVQDDRLGDIVPVLSKPYHLSYPCTFQDHGDFFMIPESGNNGTIDLYRCRRFPNEWTHEKELWRGRAVDTTVWIENGRYWFFVTFVEPRALPTQLWLFSAESLTGAWTAHPANPISADVRNSRGAGAIFRHRGRLIRPSQDGSGRYGRSFALNSISTLSPSSYAEAPEVTIEPPDGFIGTHSYSRAGQVEAIDGNAMLPC